MDSEEGIKKCKFIGENGKFHLESPDNVNYLYFPLCNENGLMSSITPSLHGDIKTSQHTFILPPVSVEDLHNTMNGRNFWIYIDELNMPWAINGKSIVQQSKKFTAEEEKVVLECGFLWHKIIRMNKSIGIKAEILNFVPIEEIQAEFMQIKITNIGSNPLTITPTAAIPMYCRSADNIRDHRHVTSLFHTIFVLNEGIIVKPVMRFDERGHHKNDTSYGVFGSDNEGDPPVGYLPTIEDFIGNGGSLEWPKSIVTNNEKIISSNTIINGLEAMGGLRFKRITLNADTSAQFRIIISIYEKDKLLQILQYLDRIKFHECLNNCEKFWKNKLNRLNFYLRDEDYNFWLKWVVLQPILRRIYGCSFLPYFDYGKGGRGWRDLWQDCLSLLFLEARNVKDLILNNFAGVKIDGSNATIIGNIPGEFKSDRNEIPRVWMEHGVWPFLTTKFYIDQTGDLGILLKEQTYFNDKFTHRCQKQNSNWSSEKGSCLLTHLGKPYKGSILEHIMIQHLTSFFNVGKNNNILLESGDWNDGLDMAREMGESVAFSAMYGRNLLDLAYLLSILEKKLNIEKVDVCEELLILIDSLYQNIDYNSPNEKKQLLEEYFDRIQNNISGNKIKININSLITDFEKKGNWILQNIRNKEWIINKNGFQWFNGYYDNDGQRLEGDHTNGVRITLTGQVFPLLSKLATNNQIDNIIKSVNNFLWDENLGGVRLNSNFGSILLNMGRCFGFAYGHKENGSVFNHMAVMYAYSLLSNERPLEGIKILETIYHHCRNFNKSKILPGIPEYFGPDGRGMYHYLTGSASWYLLTLLTKVFGVSGKLGDLLIHPMLLHKHFNSLGESSVVTTFAGKILKIIFRNHEFKDYNDYMISFITLNNHKINCANNGKSAVISRIVLEELEDKIVHEIIVNLI